MRADPSRKGRLWEKKKKKLSRRSDRAFTHESSGRGSHPHWSTPTRSGDYFEPRLEHYKIESVLCIKNGWEIYEIRATTQNIPRCLTLSISRICNFLFSWTLYLLAASQPKFWRTFLLNRMVATPSTSSCFGEKILAWRRCHSDAVKPILIQHPSAP